MYYYTLLLNVPQSIEKNAAAVEFCASLSIKIILQMGSYITPTPMSNITAKVLLQGRDIRLSLIRVHHCKRLYFHLIKEVFNLFTKFLNVSIVSIWSLFQFAVSNININHQKLQSWNRNSSSV